MYSIFVYRGVMRMLPLHRTILVIVRLGKLQNMSYNNPSVYLKQKYTVYPTFISMEVSVQIFSVHCSVTPTFN